MESKIYNKTLSKICEEVFYIRDFKDSLEEAVFIRKHFLNGNEIVVLDGYQFNTEYQIEIKNHCSKLVCIDDEALIFFVADLVFNHSPGIKLKDYNKAKNTKLCLGLEYLMLRPSFLKQKFYQKPKKKFKTLFVCFGGSDNHDYSRKVIETTIKISFLNQITLIIGPKYKIQNNWIEKLQTEYSHFFIFKNLNEFQMAKKMSQSDIVIVPSSTIALEALALNKIILTGVTEKNQQKTHDGISKFDHVFSVDFLKFTSENLIQIIQFIENNLNPKILFNSSKNILKEFKNL